MAARKWSVEQRAAQATLVRAWEPWSKSTGPRTFSGKAIVSQNAYRGNIRPIMRLARWVFWAMDNIDKITPAQVQEAKLQCDQLLPKQQQWIIDIMEKYEAHFSKE